MPFSRIAENRIREAIAEGKFQDLSGSGKPIDLDEYFSTPEELRMGYAILKNAKCAPIEVELLREIARLKEELAAPLDQARRRTLQRTLACRQTELAVMLERRSRHEK